MKEGESMQFTADLVTLKAVLADVARFTSGSTNAGLASAHITVESNTATFTGFDGESGIRVSTAVTNSVDGTALLPRQLLDYVSALPAGSVAVAVDANMAKVTSGSLSAKFRCDDPAHYPVVSFLDSEPTALPTAALQNGLKQARIAAAAPTSNRPALCGVLFEVNESSMRLVATDSYRLALATVASSTLPDGTRCTLPIRAVNELDRLLSRVPNVDVRLSDTSATFTFGNVVLTTRLLSQAFPNYGAIIPAASEVGFTVDAAAVAESVKRLKIVAPKETRSLRVSTADGVVTLSTTSASGDAVVEPIAATVAGSPPEFAVNIDYFAEAIATVGTETVAVSVTDALKPLLITGTAGDSIKHVVMPVRA